MFTDFTSSALIACATCIGSPGEITTIAANSAIFIMLGLLALVLGGVGVFIVYLARRAGGNDPVSP